MKDIWLKKWIAVSIILLFIGIAVAPSLNQSVVKASTDDDFVEVTTQACGIQGFGDTTMMLTRKQATELDQLCENIYSQLNNVSSREEFAHIYHDALIELNTYGLLPQGMTIEQAQRLVSGAYQNHDESVMKKQQELFPNCVNAFCLLSLTAVKSRWVYPILAPFGPLFLFATFLSQIFYTLGASMLYNIVFPIILFLSVLNPFKLMNLVMIRGYYTDLHSIGIKGVVDSDDVFLLVGFTGLMIITLQEKVYFFGSALSVVSSL